MHSALSLRIINKVKRGTTMMQEMRVFIARPDGTADRIGTMCASRATIAMLRFVIEKGARESQIRCEITEPKGSMPGHG